MHPATYRAQINKALKSLGLKIVGGKGYSYFLDLKTGNQVGDSVMVYRQSDLSVAEWVTEARFAKMSK